MNSIRPLRQPQSTVIVIVIALSAAAVLAATLASAQSKNKTLHLIGVTKKDARPADKPILLAFTKQHRTVGSANLPSCSGTGTLVTCSGKVTIKHVGRKMSTLITWHCPTTPPLDCSSGRGGLAKGTKSLGSIRLNVQPDTIKKKGKTFSVLVTKRG